MFFAQIFAAQKSALKIINISRCSRACRISKKLIPSIITSLVGRNWRRGWLCNEDTLLRKHRGKPKTMGNLNITRALTVYPDQLTYWDTLPADVLPKIARLQPSLTTLEWSPFRTAASLLFHTIQFQIGNVRECTGFDVIASTITISACDACSALPHVEQVLNACGSSLKTIKICRSYHRIGGEDCTPLVSLVEKHCPNVESLAFGRQRSSICTWAGLVERYGAQLRSIRYSQIVVGRLPRFDACTGLLRLDCKFLRSDTLISMLQSVGRTLEELTVRFDDIPGPDGVLHAIQTYCRRLSVIRLNDYWYFCAEPQRTALLCSYGPQLVKADVGGLRPISLREVARKCPSLRTSFLFYYDWDETKWDHIKAIGPLIDDLRLENYPCAGGKSADAMARCINLRRLRVENENFVVSDEIMSNIFANSRYRTLEDLDIRGLLVSKLNLELVAKSTLNLRKVSFLMPCFIEDANIFKSIVDSNPYLTEVILRESSRFYCERHADDALEILRSLLLIFCKCHKLHILLRVVHEDNADENQLRQICRHSPCHRMNLMVRISNALYKQTGYES